MSNLLNMGPATPGQEWRDAAAYRGGVGATLLWTGRCASRGLALLGLRLAMRHWWPDNASGDQGVSHA